MGLTTLVGGAIALLLSLSQGSQAQEPTSEPANLFDLISPDEPSTVMDAPEVRGVWLTNIDSDVLFSSSHLKASLEQLAQIHFNTVYPSVWNWGYTLFPSPVAEEALGVEVDPHPALQQRDMLAEALEEGHRLGLAVIPWFEFGLMVPSYSELARRHPDWITAREDGSTVVMQGRHPRRWLNPLHPQVQDFLVDLVADVVTRYDVDGIQLDDHFGMPIELGYDPYTVAQYQAEHDGDDPPSDRQDAEWIEWRSQHVTALMERIVQRVQAIKPDCIISLSPNPSDFAYQNYAQDWNSWLEKGWLDELIVQVYRSDLSSFTSVLDDSTLQAQRQQTLTGIGILTGLKNSPTPAPQIREQVETARDRQYSGVSFFFYESLGDRNEFYQSLFPHPAPRT